jgi:hypothetical protein
LWIDETMAPLEAAQHLRRQQARGRGAVPPGHDLHALPVVILRTSRFFPEEDDMAHEIIQSGDNTKANEYLFRRSQRARTRPSAHVVALDRAKRDRLRHLHRLGADAVHARRLRAAHGPKRRSVVERLLPRVS